MFTFSFPSLTAAQEITVSKDIITAQNALTASFDAISVAEAAGANVTNLLAQLNQASDLLAQAENAFRSGDLNLASRKANAVVPIAEKVSYAAKNLESAAMVNATETFLLTLAFSITGIGVFVFILLFIWRRFKRAHMMKVLGMKPEVVENAT
jgi:uncharacterized membrane protein YccC